MLVSLITALFRKAFAAAEERIDKRCKITADYWENFAKGETRQLNVVLSEYRSLHCEKVALDLSLREAREENSFLKQELEKMKSVTDHQKLLLKLP